MVTIKNPRGAVSCEGFKKKGVHWSERQGAQVYE
jgi:hypothetical protein